MSKELEFVLGHDEAGEKVICDLEKMPHLLIAGVAGTGKTTLLLKMMQAFSQHGIDMIAADATLGADMAELDLPKLMIPLALGKKCTVALIKFAKRELDRRCGLLSSSGARDIKRYNETAEEKLAVILGTEGDGLAESTIARCDYTVKIPMSHGVDSLNVAAASAVAFWQLGHR